MNNYIWQKIVYQYYTDNIIVQHTNKYIEKLFSGS